MFFLQMHFINFFEQIIEITNENSSIKLTVMKVCWKWSRSVGGECRSNRKYATSSYSMAKVNNANNSTHLIQNAAT